MLNFFELSKLNRKAVASFVPYDPLLLHNKLVKPPNLCLCSRLSMNEIVGPFTSHLLWNSAAPNPSRLPLYKRVYDIFLFSSLLIQSFTVFPSYSLRIKDLLSQLNSDGTRFRTFSTSSFSLSKSY